MQVSYQKLIGGEQQPTSVRKSALIRSLRLEDSRGLFDLNRSLHQESRANILIAGATIVPDSPFLGEYRVKKWIRRLINLEMEGRAVASVAEVNGIPVGITDIIRPTKFTTFGSTEGELFITIKDSHRGKGIGSELMRDVLEKGRDKFEAVILIVNEGNERAIKLYNKFGFSIFDFDLNYNCAMLLRLKG